MISGRSACAADSALLCNVSSKDLFPAIIGQSPQSLRAGMII
jgi:hypothetical protein